MANEILKLHIEFNPSHKSKHSLTAYEIIVNNLLRHFLRLNSCRINKKTKENHTKTCENITDLQ